MAFEGLSDRLEAAFGRLKSKGSLTENDVKEAMREVRLALLEADVNYKVAKDFTAKVIINFRNNRPFYFNLKEWKKIEIPDKYNMPEDIPKMVNHNLVIQQARRDSFKEAFRLISYFCNEGLYLSDEE